MEGTTFMDLVPDMHREIFKILVASELRQVYRMLLVNKQLRNEIVSDPVYRVYQKELRNSRYEFPWDTIAKNDLQVYRALVLAIPSYRRKMSCPLKTRAMKNHFTISEVDEYGTRHWWLNGKRHREDGPAYEGVNGTRRWALHGRWHREDGPAISMANGYREWWLYGEEYSQMDYRFIMSFW